jgi:hypothetical protein
MKPPGWFTLTYRGPGLEPNTDNYEMRIKRWHPGFWAFVIRTLWRLR